MSMLHCIALGAFIVLFGALLRGLGWASTTRSLAARKPCDSEAPLRYATESMIAMVVGAAIIGACALTLLAKAVAQ